MKKTYIAPIVALIVIVAGLAGWAIFGEKSPATSEYIAFPVERIEQVDLGITTESVEFLENRIAEYQIELDKEDLSAPDRITYLVGQAFDYRNLGEYALMDKVISEAASLAPDSQPVLKTYSEMLFIQERYQESLDVAERTIALDPTSYLPWLWRVELEEKLLVEPIGASAVFEQALVQTNYDVDIMVAYAEFLERQGDTARAKDIWNNTADRYPERASVFVERAELLEE